MRIYEISKQLGVSNKEILDLLHKKGFTGQSHMAALSQDLIDYLHATLAKKPTTDKGTVSSIPDATEKKKQEPIIRQASKESMQARTIEQKFEEKPLVKSTELQLKPMTLGELSMRIGVPANELILHLLRQGIICTINQQLSLKQVEQLATFYNVKFVQSTLKKESIAKIERKAVGQARLPIVVVIGHVDHGKTTLLDHIRKTRVAAKEKGGITQHLGAYQVDTPHGSLVFLDTPGHEAFSKMRARGVKIADIAILVVAADDSVKPQTIEAIKHAQSAEIPIIVAINKIDKVPATQLEKVKQDLTQHGLLPEEWGGQIICVPISAKQGIGIDQLLEMIALQAELMELKADQAAPARGFILEANMEKGRGPVATIIIHQGTLSVGQYFVAGNSYGKVNALVDSYGKSLKSVGPSIPVKVAGFEKLPEAGDVFEVVDESHYKKARTEKLPVVEKEPKPSGESVATLIIKADNKSSGEALVDAIKRLSQSFGKEINIVHTAVGDITESDISLAINTNAIIYGFHVKFEPNAVVFAQQEGVHVKLYDVIYHLLEEIEKSLKAEQAPKKERIKIGQAEVRKIFSIKGLGVIAGSYVKEGKIARNAEVEIFRNNQKIAQGPIKSLERDRKPVKEVHKGFECAFLVDNFNDWQEGDRVDFYVLKVPGL